MDLPQNKSTVFLYNTTTPVENASEFNYLYGPNGLISDGNGNPFFATDQNWQQVLAFESEIAMRHVLSFSSYPHFFHQNNLKEYAPGRSLIYDWSEAVLNEYDKYFATPIISQDWEGITTTLENRTSFFEGLQDGSIYGTWNRGNNTVKVSSSKAATVYITGAKFSSGNSWRYGPDNVSSNALSANQSVTGSVSNTSTYSPPFITSTRTSASGIEGQAISMTWDVRNTNNTFLGWSATNLPPGLAINPATGTITGTYACDSAGTYNTTVYASDGTIQALKSLTWTVSAGTLSGCTPEVGPVATLYQHYSFRGWSHELTVGDYPSLADLGIPNNKLFSLKIADGYTVELYDFANFQGTKQVLTSNSNAIRTFNNKATSAKVYLTNGASYKYDLGTNTSPVASDYTRLTASGLTGVNFSGTRTIRGITNNLDDDLYSDSVGSNRPGTFSHVLENGTYQVTLGLGGGINAKNALTAIAEGVTIANAVATPAQETIAVTAVVPVRDGALNIDIIGGTQWWTITEIIIRQLK